MTKKALSLLLALLMLLSLAACGNAGTKQEEDNTPEQSQEARQPEETKENQSVEHNEASTPIQFSVESDLASNKFHVSSTEIPELGFAVVLPDSWTGKYDLRVASGGALVFYCSEARTELGGGGKLFELEWARGQLPEDAMLAQPGEILKNEEAFHMILAYSSDMQYGELSAEIYDAMHADLEQVQVIFDN